jgi:hypothetical protein
MRRTSIAIAVAFLLAAPLGGPAAASASPDVDVATLEARIERAQRRVEAWYARIERWYARIDRASVRLERLEQAVTLPSSNGRLPVASRSTPRRRDPSFLLAEARRELRRTLKDPSARHAQAELDTWSAFLAEMVHARERALRPAPEEDGHDLGGRGGGSDGIAPGEPVTYEGWAGEFLRHLSAPSCRENLLIVVTWETAESTTAAFNPLATTRDMPGATDMNSVGVKDFVSLRQGLDASRDTLLLGAESYAYGAIVDSLRRCRSAEVTARAINASAWCRGCVGGAYITGLLPLVRASYPEHASRLVSTSA